MPNEIKNLFDSSKQVITAKPGKATPSRPREGYTGVMVWTMGGVVLAACVDSDHAADDLNTAFVADGPVWGARVFADVDGNGRYDPGEPFGITDETGYAEILPGNNLEGHPIIADVNGAIDVETGAQLTGTYYGIEPLGGEVRVIATPLTDFLVQRGGDYQGILNSIFGENVVTISDVTDPANYVLPSYGRSYHGSITDPGLGASAAEISDYISTLISHAAISLTELRYNPHYSNIDGVTSSTVLNPDQLERVLDGYFGYYLGDPNNPNNTDIYEALRKAVLDRIELAGAIQSGKPIANGGTYEIDEDTVFRLGGVITDDSGAINARGLSEAFGFFDPGGNSDGPSSKLEGIFIKVKSAADGNNIANASIGLVNEGGNTALTAGMGFTEDLKDQLSGKFIPGGITLTNLQASYAFVDLASIPDLIVTPNTNYHGDLEIEFRVWDGENFSAASTLTVTVISIDEAPEIISGATGTELVENSLVLNNTPVYTATGTDDDDIIVWSLLESGDGGLFKIDASGVVTFQNDTTPDFETQGSYTFTVRATSEELFTDQVVTIAVRNVDEAPTAMTFPGEPGARVSEDATGARKLADIIFTGGDTIGTDTVTLSGSGSTLFEIQNRTELWLKDGVALDYETATSHTVTLTPSVTGTGASLLDDVLTFTLDVDDVDEAPTAMTLSPSTASVAEDTTAARELAVITFTDDALGTNTAEVNYVAVGEKKLFDIRDSTTTPGKKALWLNAGVALDYETATSHTVTVTPSVTGSGSAPAAQTFTLNVTDANDEAPEITSDVTGTALAENTAVSASTAVYTATADPDVAGAAITWSLVKVPGDGNDDLFEIDSNTGAVTFKSDTTPNFEVKNTYTFTVRASSSNLTDDQTVTIAVTDVDEAPTAMTLSPGTGSVAEGTTAARELAVIDFTDDALGVNTATVDDTTLFEILDSTSTLGVKALWLKAGAALDFETATSHTVTVTASTNSALTQTFTLNVTDANDVAPVITSGATGTALAENTLVSASTPVYTATGEPDVAGAAITWSLVKVAGDGNDDLFNIDSNTGVVTFQSDTTPNHEVKEEYTFTVQANSGGLTTDRTVTIAVTDVDEAPTAMTLSPGTESVAEGSAAQELAVITFTDDDLGTNTATVDDTTRFEIRNGTQLWLKAGAALDFETATSHTVTVTPSVSGSGSAPAAQTFTLNVTDANDVAPVITSGATGTALAENTLVSASTAVYTATGTPDVAGAAITWSLSGSDDDGLFSINAGSGEVTFQSDTTPNHEVKEEYTFTVQANSGGLTTDQVVTIAVTDLNDVAPVITSGATGTALAENTLVSASTAVYTATGTPDVAGAAITWSLSGSDDDGLFSINAGSGEVTFQSDTTPNHEVKEEYTFTVQANSGGLNTDQVVTIAVTDLNDVAPVITSGATGTALAENTLVSASTAVYTATADPDVAGAAITWSLVKVPGDGNDDLFDINATSGAVTFNSHTIPDHETKDTYTFTVQANSGGLTTDQTVTIAVTDVDEAPTAMTLSTGTGSVAEGTTTAQELAVITFTDDDLGTNTATVNTVEVGGETLFEIRNGTELWLKAGVDLDFETATSHTVTVTPSVSGTGSAPATLNFTLDVTNVNETPSITVTDNEDISNDVETAISFFVGTNDENTVLFTLSGTDPDASTTLTWSLVSGSADTDLFEFKTKENQDIEISWKDNPTDSTKSSNNDTTFSLEVQLADDGSPSLTDDVTLTVVLFASGGG
ncbi:beta strand repeat-containing protein [Alphaproteobacteria bacterium LSUCC0684]